LHFWAWGLFILYYLDPGGELRPGGAGKIKVCVEERLGILASEHLKKGGDRSHP
jgi:hypothetical protein